jgi:serine/threonine protein phosphatase PrpC
MEEVERWARAVDGLATGFAAFDLFAHINRQIVEVGLANEHWRGMGTTLTLVYLCTGQFYFAHIGDSRLHILREGHPPPDHAGP